jgi:tRNA (guanine-N7-)-methyltransferase
MPKRKKQQFAELREFSNVFQPEIDWKSQDKHPIAKQWAQFFGNHHPLVLELGCGKGEYTTGLAALFPELNYIGVDIKGARIWRGAKTALENGLLNVAFVRSKIDVVHRLFPEHSVKEIWLTFSDPQPERPRKRLTSEIFVNRYRKLLMPGGTINVKTDSDLFYESTLEEINTRHYALHVNSNNIYCDLPGSVGHDVNQSLQIQTFYESRWRKEGKTIKFVQFTP